jgi:hypothetical protein
MGVSYEPTWLRGHEIIGLFPSADDARAWLARAVDDKGIVADRQADPATDLFRLPQVVLGHRGRRWRANSRAIDWGDFSIEAPATWRRIRAKVPIEASTQLLRFLMGSDQASGSADAALKKNTGGRPPAADWNAIRDALQLEIQRRGLPDQENERGWQTQADVESWVAGALADRRENAGEATIRRHVRAMLDAISAETGGGAQN